MYTIQAGASLEGGRMCLPLDATKLGFLVWAKKFRLDNPPPKKNFCLPYLLSWCAPEYTVEYKPIYIFGPSLSHGTYIRW